MIFLTPSYRNDLDRLFFQRQSILRCCTERATHLVVVPKNDYRLFRRRFVGDPLVEILIQNDFVDPRFYAKRFYGMIRLLPESQVWRFARFAGRSGWVIQQIVKLAASEMTAESTVLITDSDTIFFRQFGSQNFSLSGHRRILIRKTVPENQSPHRTHIINSRRLLRLPDGNVGLDFMSVPMVWHMDWLRALKDYLEQTYAQSWQKVLLGQSQLSEYTIYGLFVDEILAPKSLKVRPEPYNFGLWTPEEIPALPAYLERIRRLATNVPEDLDMEPICFTLQSWLNLPLAEYWKILEVAACRGDGR